MVLVIGSINMDVSFQVQDIPHPGETVMASGVKKSPGGKGANQAYAASKLGGKVTMLGCVGQDENGETLLASLDSAGVDISHIKKQADNATSSAFICVSASGENSIVVDSSANALVSPAYLAENESLFENAEYCILQMEIPYETVSTAIALCQKHHVKVVLNPSPLTAFDKQLLYGVDYLVPNETEASALIGMPYEQAGEQDWIAFMQEYRIKNLIITLGKQGCRYYDGSKPSQAYPSERRAAIDTTGAGDTFLGALVAALSQEEPIHNAIRYANAASGIEVTRHGAQQAVPTKEEVDMISKNILIDTDIGPDCDDVAALAMLNIYANRGLCRILGIGHCTANVYGVGTIDAICRFYDRPDVEIGTYKAPGFLCDEKCIIYNKAITEEFPNRYRNHQPEDACAMYRRILAGQPDHSVEFIAIGPLNNLSDLLDSGADVYSPLSGKELVAQKVTRLVMMAGIFTAESAEANAMVKELTGHTAADMEEFNVVCDIPAARNVAENWPTPKEYLGFEAGMVQTGIPAGAGIGPEHPVKRAYELYTEDGRRYSWDLLTVEHAINDNCPHYKLSAPGHVRFDEKGRTVWTPDAQGSDRYVIWAQPSEKIETDINALLCTAE